MTSLIDRFGRRINYLRLSVTDRCDFRCVYCMGEDITFLPRSHILSLEELAQTGRAFVDLGVRKIRITGGEPLVRKNVLQLFQTLGRINELDELSLTTNGSQLARLAQPLRAAGVKRVNISLDSLQPARFKHLTGNGELQPVLNGIRAAQKAGFERLKLNSVILRGRNDDEIVPLVYFCQNEGLDLAFIEAMPLGIIREHNRAEAFISSADIRAVLAPHYTLTAIAASTGGPSRYYAVAGSDYRIGFISPHSHNFCGDCNRVRLTAAGRLLLCLGNEHSLDLRHILRSQPGDSEALQQAIIGAMALKPEKHYFDLNAEPEIVRFMSATGG